MTLNTNYDKNNLNTWNYVLSSKRLFCFALCSVFCPASTDDEARDLANQKRIRSFNWISPQHLDAAINPDSEKVQQLIEDSQQGIVIKI